MKNKKQKLIKQDNNALEQYQEHTKQFLALREKLEKSQDHGNINSKKRLEGFSDAVIAIIATITVLEIPIPQSFSAHNIQEFIMSIVVFLVSFVIIMNLWNNQRKLLDYAEIVSDKFMWRSIYFISFLALLPLFTKWMIEAMNTEMAKYAIFGYGIVYLLINFFHNTLFIVSTNDQLKQAALNRNERWFLNTFKRRSIILVVVTSNAIIINCFIALVNAQLAVILLLFVPIFSSLFKVFENQDKPKKPRNQIKRRK